MIDRLEIGMVQILDGWMDGGELKDDYAEYNLLTPFLGYGPPL